VYILTADRGAIWRGIGQVWTQYTIPKVCRSKRYGVSCVVLWTYRTHTGTRQCGHFPKQTHYSCNADEVN